MKDIIVAIDGFSACGKSTLAKDLASAVHYTYIDSGAMYRAVAFYAIHSLRCPTEDNVIAIDTCKDEIISHLPNISIGFSLSDNVQRTMLNGIDVEDEIRTSQIGQNASVVATVKEIRQHLVHLQQQFGKNKRVVMDGRDIGTVVFPNAEMKVFLTATFDVRARRRYRQLYLSSEIDEQRLNDVKFALKERDYRDTHRSESPLIQASDAIVIDNSNFSREQQLETVISLFKQIINE